MNRSTVAVLLAAVAPTALAQVPEEPAVIVTATRFPENRLDAPVGMTVITAREISESTARTLPELLAREAGIVTRDSTGGPDWQVDLRGFGITGDQNTLVLLNGQRLNENELVTLRWSAIPLESIERIEIMRGSGAVLYGGGATAGTINIITKTPRADALRGTAGISAGSYRTREYRVGLNVAGAASGVNLHASDDASDNYRDNNRVEQRNVAGDLRWFAPRGYIAVKVGLDRQEQRLPGARTAEQLESDRRGASTPGDYSQLGGERGALAAAYDADFGEFAVELAYRGSVRASLLKDYTGLGFPDIYTDTRTRHWSLTPRSKTPYGAFGAWHSLVVGVDAEYWDYDSRKASGLEALADPTARVFATQRSWAFYAQQNSSLGEDAKLTLGARRQRVTTAARDVVNPAAYSEGVKTSRPTSWEVALRQGVAPDTAIYGRIGRSFRIATIDEVYSQFGGPVFDSVVTLLEPQTSRDREIGVEYRRPDVRARASAFLIDLEDEIYFFAPTFSNINLPPTRRKGLELDISMRAGTALTWFGNASVTQARFRDGGIGGVDVTGNTIPLVPRNAANAGFSWQLDGGTRLTGVLRYVGTQYYDNDQTNSFPTRMPAYKVADLKLAHSLLGLTVSAAINNLFNERYYSYAIRNGPGTSFNAYPQRERNLLVTLEFRS